MMCILLGRLQIVSCHSFNESLSFIKQVVYVQHFKQECKMDEAIEGDLFLYIRVVYRLCTTTASAITIGITNFRAIKCLVSYWVYYCMIWNCGHIACAALMRVCDSLYNLAIMGYVLIQNYTRTSYSIIQYRFSQFSWSLLAMKCDTSVCTDTHYSIGAKLNTYHFVSNVVE
jgi:hypothetical protein